MPIQVENIYRYPVKGLGPEGLEQVELIEGRAVTGDRRFALALGSTPADSASSDWLPKSSFLMLQRDEKLALLETQFDAETDTLTILRGGHQVSRGKLTDTIGRSMIEEFFAAYMGEAARGRPKVVVAEGAHTISDYRAPVVSIINLASVSDLERVTGKPVDPLRFRANFYIAGADPWSEFDWLNGTVTLGGARLKVIDRTERCAATNVNPSTAERDLNIPRSLQQGFGHVDCGVYAEVIGDGRVAVGDVLTPIDTPVRDAL